MMMQYPTRGLILLAVIALAIGTAAAQHTQDSLATVKKNIAEKKGVLVDVREKAEWDGGHIEGAVLLPLSELQRGVDAEALSERLPQKRILYTHCVVGKRSVTAGELLKKHGYDVRPLKAGYKDLLGAGFPKAGK